ncbi:MAG: hypothetical protein LBK58_04855 [Prevotellaceae bacterium]|jgi:hypothetical protein|nr:hypothetical protein [Prevotellaceae bacterium]
MGIKEPEKNISDMPEMRGIAMIFVSKIRQFLKTEAGLWCMMEQIRNTGSFFGRNIILRHYAKNLYVIKNKVAFQDLYAHNFSTLSASVIVFHNLIQYIYGC